jgi:hypothetical protein
MMGHVTRLSKNLHCLLFSSDYGEVGWRGIAKNFHYYKTNCWRSFDDGDGCDWLTAQAHRFSTWGHPQSASHCIKQSNM